MELRKLSAVTQIDIRFTEDGQRFVPDFTPNDRRSVPLPMEIAVDGGFQIAFTHAGERIRFGIRDAHTAHLYNFRTPRYTDGQLQAFQSVFERLHLFDYDDGRYLGLKDGRGLFDLTPFVLKTAGTAFLGYFILTTGSDGESRHAPTPDVLFLGELVEVAPDSLNIPENLFVHA